MLLIPPPYFSQAKWQSSSCSSVKKQSFRPTCAQMDPLQLFISTHIVSYLTHVFSLPSLNPDTVIHPVLAYSWDTLHSCQPYCDSVTILFEITVGRCTTQLLNSGSVEVTGF